jgi:predicted ABC-type ATPase
MASENKRPIFWIVAGPNGSGKSSLYTASDIDAFGSSVWIINPDLLAARISAAESLSLLEANLQAVQRIYRWLEASIDAHQTIGVETVLSTPKYRDVVKAAQKREFEVRLVYVILRSVDLNIERVRTRVAKGGHAVAEEKIRQRWHRSLDQLPWFLDQSDRAWIYDNSGRTPRLVGEKSGAGVEWDVTAPPALQETLSKHYFPGRTS